jgi:ketosteroid isomerase-like protein
MSQENVEVVERFTDAVNRGDREAAAAVLHDDVQWHTIAGPILGVDAVSGRDEAIRFAFEQIPDGIENFRATIGEVRQLPSGDVLASARYEGRGVASGAVVEMNATQIYRFDDGMIIFFKDFTDRTEALQAAGLSE